MRGPLGADEDISPDEMLKIAKELKGFVSEVGYVKKINEGTFDLRYYSSEREVDFCGHATIAIMYDLIKNSCDLMKKERVHIITRKGKLSVENRIDAEDAVFITAPDPIFSSVEISPAHIAKALKINLDEIETGAACSPAIVNAGLETLIVPVKHLDAMLSMSPEFDELKEFCVKNSIDIITAYSNEVADQKNRCRVRVFVPVFGYLEDPATGSGNSALGHYLLKNNLWDGAFMALEQNQSRENPNIIKLMAKKDSDSGKSRVIFGGGAIAKIDGEYILQ